MHIVATGMTGFLGSWTLDLLLRQGHSVLALHRNSSAMDRIRPYLEHPGLALMNIEARSWSAPSSDSVDAVLHCATHYGRAQFDPRSMIDTNIVLPLRLLSLAAEFGAGCFVNTDTVLDKGISSYALSKHQFGQWLDAYAARIRSRSVAFEHFYGGMDDPTKFTSHILGALCQGAGSIALTQGAQRRYFLHVRDASRALVAALESCVADSGAGHALMQVGSPQSIPIRQFVESAWEAAGRPAVRLDFGALPYRDGEKMDPVLDLGAIHATGWRASVSLADGLAQAMNQQRSGHKAPAHGDFE